MLWSMSAPTRVIVLARWTGDDPGDVPSISSSLSDAGTLAQIGGNVETGMIEFCLYLHILSQRDFLERLGLRYD